ncbi:unnamed protein product [Caenorhabditis bovis]|uniref:von Hippel-Lindau disease tumour suppressor beta domain-containing protein n=1 Tax=Caenorhabditis bovis TaxID=2654633 RepID=A0A8S1EFR3_9PELO|nr:unnamed protein product [Caenorhabditis bovis]
MDEQNERPQELRLFPHVGSSNTGREARARFYNLTSYPVDIIWLRAPQVALKYGTLTHKQYLDVRTYQKHPWVFRRHFDGAIMLANKEEIYWATEYSPNVVLREAVYITMPMWSLQKMCAYKIANSPELHRNIDILPTHVAQMVRRIIYCSDIYQQTMLRPRNNIPDTHPRMRFRPLHEPPPILPPPPQNLVIPPQHRGPQHNLVLVHQRPERRSIQAAQQEPERQRNRADEQEYEGQLQPAAPLNQVAHRNEAAQEEQ